MTKKIIIFVVGVMMTVISHAQVVSERPIPSQDTTIVRKCAIMDVDGKKYKDCCVVLMAMSPAGGVICHDDREKVNVFVYDKKGKKVYMKTFFDVQLFLLDGKVQVGNTNVTKV